MTAIFEHLREFNFAAVAFRLMLAMLFGGMLGIERAHKRRAAGFRTYMIVCMSAALTMILGQYESAMLLGRWQNIAGMTGINIDVARFGAQVINGIGFLGAGTIIVTAKQQVIGLTTAAGLWASACMGLAVGAGFYECVLFGFALIFLSFRILPRIETAIIERARNMNIYVEFLSLDDVGRIIARIKAQGAQIYEVDITRKQGAVSRAHSAVFAIRLDQRHAHERILTSISELESVVAIEEV